MRHRLLCLALLCGFVRPARAQFVLYNALGYTGTPSHIYLPYLQGFTLDYGPSVAGSSGGTCTANNVNIITYANAGLSNPSWPVSFDVEISWPTSGTALTDSMDNYIAIIDTFKAHNSVSPISFYGVPPYPDCYDWAGVNANLAGVSSKITALASVVDYFSPSFYDHDTDDTTTWREYVDTVFSVIHQYYGTTKPIYPYIWPQYDGGTKNAQFMDTSTWQFMLNYLYAKAGGAIVWSGSGTWNPNASWWQVTKEFMAQKGLVPPIVIDTFYSAAGSLHWATSTDTPTRYYIVQRSANDTTFVSISGNISKSGGYYTENSYAFTDTTAATGPVYYRLGAVSYSGAVKYMDTISYAFYRSAGTGLTVDLGSASGWQVEMSGGTWVSAATAPANLGSGVVAIRPADTWQNNITSVQVSPGVTILDSGATGTFSNLNMLESGSIVFCGTTAQAIPPATGFHSQTIGGNLVIANAAGVATTGSSYLGINGTLQLNAGTLSSGGASLYLDGPVAKTGGYLGSTHNVGFYGSTAQTILAGLFPGNTVTDLLIKNSAGVSLPSGAVLHETGLLSLQSGTFSLGSGDSLYIGGSISYTAGGISTGSGMVMLNGNLPQSIPSGTFSLNTVSALALADAQGITYSGALDVTGNLHLSAGATLSGGTTLGFGSLTIDTLGAVPQVSATGTATIGGTLTIASKFAVTPAIGQQFTIASAGSPSGSFSGVSLPSGYSGTVANVGGAVVLTITAVPYNCYESPGTGVSVDLGSTTNWLTYSGGAWVAATSAPATLTSGVVTIQPGDTWNNASAVTLHSGVTVIDSGTTGTFSTTNHLLDSGTIVYIGASAQTIPASTAFTGESMYGNVIINNAAGVTSTGTSYLNIGSLSLYSGTLTSGGGSFYLDGPVLLSGAESRISTSQIVGFYGTAPQTIPANLFPDSATRVLYIKNSAGVSLTPGAILDVTGTLDLQAGVFTLNGGDSLLIGGAISYTSGGIQSDSNAVIAFNGTSAQTIPADAFVSDTVRYLDIDNPAGVSFSDTLYMAHNIRLSAGATLSGGSVIGIPGLTIDTLGTTTPVAVTGAATISGTLSVSNKFAVTPVVGQRYTILSAGSINGAFSGVSLPAGYAGSVSNVGNTVVLTITGVPYGNYRSPGIGVPVDLGTTTNWAMYNGTTWVAATSAPATLTSGVVEILPGDTWNNASAITIHSGVRILDSGYTGTFSTSNRILDSGTIVYAGSTSQIIPASTSFASETIYGNILIDNPAGVWSTGYNYLGINDSLQLLSGTLTSGGGSFYLSGPVLALGMGSQISSGTIVGFYGSTSQAIPAGLFPGNATADLYIKNSAGVSLATGAVVSVTGVLNLQSGVFSLGSGASLSTTGNTEVTGLSTSVTPLTGSGATVTLGGPLTISSFATTPVAGNTYTVVSAGTVIDTFSTLSLPSGITGALSYTSENVVLTISNVSSSNALSQTARMNFKGTMDSTSTTLRLFPNPATGMVFLDHPAAGSTAIIQIWMEDGRMVATAPVAQGSVQTTFDISKLSSGYYFITYQDGNARWSKGLLKQ